MKQLSKRRSVCLGFIGDYDVLHTLVGRHGHIGKGLEGQQDILEAYISHFLCTKLDCARFQPLYWMEMVVLASKETQTYGFEMGCTFLRVFLWGRSLFSRC
jgi:hypothetical protein